MLKELSVTEQRYQAVLEVLREQVAVVEVANAVRRDASDGAQLGAPLPGRWAGRAGRSLASAPWLPASDGSGGRSPHLRVAPSASSLGASAAGVRAGSRVGGRNAILKQHLLDELTAASLHAIDAAGHPDLDGNEVRNIVNRTLLGMGGHLELTGPLRQAMFEENTRPRRKDTTTEMFWRFAAACRNALARLEAGQVIL